MRLMCVLATCAAISAGASADVVFTAQECTITASTDADGGSTTRSSDLFARFTDVARRSVPFAGIDGPLVNAADSGIDCQLDPNGITAAGSLSGSGGLALINGTQTLLSGKASAIARISFTLDTPSPYRLVASARPSADPRDQYRLRLRDLDRSDTLYDRDQFDAATPIDSSGMLLPGRYEFLYQLEARFEGPDTTLNYALSLAIPTPASAGLAVACIIPAARRRRR